MKIEFKEEPLAVTTSEEFEEMEFGIKACDIGFILQLLRNDMYKYPIDAICREVASNARDANREVGSGKVPVEIIISKNPYLSSENALCIKDVGPGISPDRMKDVFLNYGASTKRDSDEQTGGFGLGAKTPFAYTNTFSIETVFENKKYVYIAVVKQGNKGRMYLLSESDCFDGSGTTISVPIKNEDVSKFEHAAYRATFFWDVRPLYKNFSTLREVNEYEVMFENENYLIATEINKQVEVRFVKSSRVAALLDGIPYEIDNSIEGVHDVNELVENLPGGASAIIFMKIKNGDVTISPNRETVQYNDKTTTRVKVALKEIAGLIKGEWEELFNRTTNLIDRHLIWKFLSGDRYFQIGNYDNVRPYSQYTRLELVKMYFGMRFAKIFSAESEKQNHFGDIKLGQYFSSYFPGLTLGRITFEEDDRVKSGIKCRFEKCEIDFSFFKQMTYFLDSPKRKIGRERTHYKQNGCDMLIIIPHETLALYDGLDLEGKKKSREFYLSIKQSISLLKEYGIDNYIAYTSLDVDKIQYEKIGKREGITFRIMEGKSAVSSMIQEWGEADFKVSDTNTPLNKGEYVYFAVNDLRDVKSSNSDFKVRYLRFHNQLFNKAVKVIYVNQKNEDRVKEHLQSIGSYIESFSLDDRKSIGDYLIMQRHNYDFRNFEGLTFASKRYGVAWSRFDKLRKKYNKVRVTPVDKFSDDEADVFRKQSDLNDIMPILKELEERFPFLRYSHNVEAEHVRDYVSSFEKSLIEKGDIE